ncbi:hypothetical protein KI387_019230, partial [Taxus chinensis]
NESLTEAIRHVANEPSLGLFFVQQHAHNSAPRLASVKNKLVDTCQEAFSCSEDMEDALNSVESLKGCGPSIIDRMIKNLDSSVSIMASLHQHRRNGGRLDQSNLSRASNTIRAVWDSAFEKSGSSHCRSHSSVVFQVRGHCNESSSSTNERYKESITDSSGRNLAASKKYFWPLKSILQRAENLGWRRSTITNRRDMNIRKLSRSYSADDLNVVVGSRRSADGKYAMNDPIILSSEATGEESAVLLREDVDNSKEMDRGDQFPVSSQALFKSDDYSDSQIP